MYQTFTMLLISNKLQMWQFGGGFHPEPLNATDLYCCCIKDWGSILHKLNHSMHWTVHFKKELWMFFILCKRISKLLYSSNELILFSKKKQQYFSLAGQTISLGRPKFFPETLNGHKGWAKKTECHLPRIFHSIFIDLSAVCSHPNQPTLLTQQRK